MDNYPTKHIKELCKELGKDYSVEIIDKEWVIYRDFHNGYEVEISCVNTTSLRKPATIHLWKEKTYTIKTIENVPQSNIGDRVEELRYLTDHNLI